jgi:hypothetical protein
MVVTPGSTGNSYTQFLKILAPYMWGNRYCEFPVHHWRSTGHMEVKHETLSVFLVDVE